MRSGERRRLSRRRLLGGVVGAAALGAAWPLARILRQPRARVLRLRVPSYGSLDDLARHLGEGIDAFPATHARIKGARIVLKPNMVEVHPGRPVNTQPRLVAAAALAFQRAGAASVTVAEGPGHVRDIERILELSAIERELAPLGVPFVDLNSDEPIWVPLPANLTGLGRLPVAATIMRADLVVSMPKLKTHHWVGATLSMKNLFGTVPGTEVGWPKNPLHQAGISRSVVDLWTAIRPGFTIVDGVVGMEGDGPIFGTGVPHGVVLMGEQFPAVDATAARLMGLRPERIDHLRLALAHGGTIAASRIEALGDAIDIHPYAVLPHWGHLRA